MAKKTKRMSRRELKEKDQVLTSLERGWQFIEEHAHKVVALLVGGVLVSAVWALWSHFSYKSEASASRAFNKAMRAYNAPVLPGGTEPSDAKKPKGGVKDSYPSVEARAKAALVLFDKMLSAHSGHELAGTARFYRANCLYQLGRYVDAIKGYRKFLAAGGGRGCGGASGRPEALEVVALENLAYSHEASGEYDEALKYFSKLESAVSGIKKEWAIYHQARMWQLKGNLTKAIALYRRVKQADRHAALSPLKPIAEKRAKYLEMGEKINGLLSGKARPGSPGKDGDTGKARTAPKTPEATGRPGESARPPDETTGKKPEGPDRPGASAREPAETSRKPGPAERKPAPAARKPAPAARKPAPPSRRPGGAGTRPVRATRRPAPAPRRPAAGAR